MEPDALIDMASGVRTIERTTEANFCDRYGSAI